MARIGRSNRRARKRSARLDPNLYLLEDQSIATADTVLNVTLLTQSEKQPYVISARDMHLEALGGNTNSRVFYVLRRVPSGYSAPSITVTSGLNTIVDQPDILLYGFINFTTGGVDSNVNTTQRLRPTMVFYEGDTLILQAVGNVTSTGLVVSGFIEWGSRGL